MNTALITGLELGALFGMLATFAIVRIQDAMLGGAR